MWCIRLESRIAAVYALRNRVDELGEASAVDGLGAADDLAGARFAGLTVGLTL
jgi:hypothetical protein